MLFIFFSYEQRSSTQMNNNNNNNNNRGIISLYFSTLSSYFSLARLLTTKKTILDDMAYIPCEYCNELIILPNWSVHTVSKYS